MQRFHEGVKVYFKNKENPDEAAEKGKACLNVGSI
jgi:hypothetical protein